MREDFQNTGERLRCSSIDTNDPSSSNRGGNDDPVNEIGSVVFRSVLCPASYLKRTIDAKKRATCVESCISHDVLLSRFVYWLVIAVCRQPLVRGTGRWPGVLARS